MDATVRPSSPPEKPRRFGFGLRMHHLLFIAFTLVASVPIAVLASWEGTTSFQNELDSVRERHLLVARNLTSTESAEMKYPGGGSDSLRMRAQSKNRSSSCRLSTLYALTCRGPLRMCMPITSVCIGCDFRC